ncbi:sestrin-3 isoform X2 [Esox lucius]|uniref:sestrin-3 isoform X2 n=1 Tax=Esox lucius TaxID=8010 RepID=UPI00147780A1|nr:sestrin-3 isoform X2 [Esox lucius]
MSKLQNIFNGSILQQSCLNGRHTIPSLGLTKRVMKVNAEKERASLRLVAVLANTGCVDAVCQQMASYPQYLESFLHLQHYILQMDGPLPLPYRHYIAIMAAARHHCGYLVSLHSAQFLKSGGDPQWLKGLEDAPLRLRHLDQLNKVLAHQPWLTAHSHIQALLKMGEQCWSLAELVQAVVLLAHCHSLASFVFGSGADSDPAPLPRAPNGTPPGYSLSDAANGNLTAPLEHGTRRRRSLSSSSEGVCLKDLREGGLVNTKTVQQTELEDEEELIKSADPSRFITDPEFGYQEFARREEDHYQVFWVQDYSWDDHGFSLVNRLYSDIGHKLDERFRRVMDLPSTHSPDLKRAIWNYIHCMLGIRYDDYNYGEINKLLVKDLKLYIKSVACYPDATKAPRFPASWSTLEPAERVHVSLLVMEARLQAELLYALRAITQYMIA